MWPYLFLGTSLSTIVFVLLWRRSAGRVLDLAKDLGKMEMSNDQFQKEIEAGQVERRKIIERNERARRADRKAARKCAADFDAIALAGKNDPAVLAALAGDLEQLFALSETEATLTGGAHEDGTETL